eukprot:ctg_748.g263
MSRPGVGSDLENPPDDSEFDPSELDFMFQEQPEEEEEVNPKFVYDLAKDAPFVNEPDHPELGFPTLFSKTYAEAAPRPPMRRILVIGSGAIRIGQACEFDYSGTQACKALRAEGYEVVLVNSNPASIMTDPEIADRTYIEPITPEVVEMIIQREKPDALLPTMGGQTGLNMAMTLSKTGVLERYNVRLIGADLAAITKGEDRLAFREAMERIGVKVCPSGIARTVEEAREVASDIGSYPLIIRPAYTLGGTGGGIAYNREEFDDIAQAGLEASPVSQILVEKSLLGWKEYELEVVRDMMDNVVIICSVENVDPMGVHTGDSFTVAPTQTLTDVEYQELRDMSIAIIREIGVDTGGSNIQFAVCPRTGDTIVIEMNPRVSRSSALASKATGYPIAKVAAKLATGLSLTEIPNDITRKTPAAFEPALDYVQRCAQHTDEVGGRGDVHRPLVRGVVPEGSALVGDRARRLGPRRQERGTDDARRAGSSAAGTTPEPHLQGATGTESGHVGAGDRRPLRLRPVVSVQDGRHFGVAGVAGARAQAGGDRSGTHVLFEKVRPQRQADRVRAAPLGRHRGEGAALPQEAGHPAGVQARGHLRRRVRGLHALPLLGVRDLTSVGPQARRDDQGHRVGGAALGPEQGQGDDPRRRAEPHRPGHRVRLRLLPRVFRVARRRLRDHHGQLESGDRDRDPGGGEAGRHHRDLRWADAAQTRRAAAKVPVESGGAFSWRAHSDSGHFARLHRHR